MLGRAGRLDPVVVGAGIAGESGAEVRGEVGGAVALRCLAYGHPEPSVYWYRGVNGPLVAFSSPAYEYLDRGRTLLIRRLSVDELGEYACQAYNGHGKPATWLIVVQAYRPDGAAGDALDSPYLVPRQTVVEVTPRLHTNAPTTTLQTEIELQPYIGKVESTLNWGTPRTRTLTKLAGIIHKSNQSIRAPFVTLDQSSELSNPSVCL